jgi:hypothetical protein
MGFWWAKLKERDRLEALDIDGRICKMVLKEIECEGVG